LRRRDGDIMYFLDKVKKFYPLEKLKGNVTSMPVLAVKLPAYAWNNDILVSLSIALKKIRNKRYLVELQLPIKNGMLVRKRLDVGFGVDSMKTMIKILRNIGIDDYDIEEV